MKKSLFAHAVLIQVLLLNFTFVTQAQAVDLGVWGESSEIAEEDFETHIVKQLEQLGENKLRTHQELIKDKIVDNIKRPKAVHGITDAVISATRLYDPSFTLKEDIYNDKHQPIYLAGKTINPLEFKAFEEIWIFIDGDNAIQVDFAKKYSDTKNRIKKIILINGAPGNQRDGSFFFYDQAGAISKKLNIEKVPSVVKQDLELPQILIEEVALVRSAGL